MPGWVDELEEVLGWMMTRREMLLSMRFRSWAPMKVEQGYEVDRMERRDLKRR